MITYWQQIDGQFTKTKKEEINSKLPLWIDARSVTRDETAFLHGDGLPKMERRHRHSLWRRDAGQSLPICPKTQQRRRTRATIRQGGYRDLRRTTDGPQLRDLRQRDD